MAPDWDRTDTTVDREGRVDDLEPEHLLESREALRQCVGKLSDYAQTLVRLRYGNELKGASLAQALNKPINTVMVALSRTNKNLARCVRSQLAGES